MFGYIDSGEMYLNALGEMVYDEWLNTMNIRKDEVVLHEFVVMPNHIHAIIEICAGDGRGVLHTPLRSPSRTVGAIVRGFKGAVTKKAGQHIWQRNYFEHIIRSGESYQLIAEYIISNPTRWNIDRFYNI